MKKILTLLMIIGSLIAANAQSRNDERRVILGGPNNENTYPSNGRDVILGGGNNGSYPSYPIKSYPVNDNRYQMDQVNREYDAKIQSIRNNGYLSYEEKQRAIRQLENDRQRKIQELSRYTNRYDRADDCNTNNGKHKGWHKNGKYNGGRNW